MAKLFKASVFYWCTWATSPEGGVQQVNIRDEEDKVFLAHRQERFTNRAFGRHNMQV